MNADDWIAIIIAIIAFAVFVAAVVAIPGHNDKTERNLPLEGEFTNHSLGKGKYPNLLTCDDILARAVAHHRNS